MVQPTLTQQPETLPGLPGVSVPTTSLPTPGAEDHLHELRVRIPVDLHRQLLSMKILRGKSLAETVSSALDIYFAAHQAKVHDEAQ